MAKDSPTPAQTHSHHTAAHNAARDKAIDLALGAIDKQFGKGAIMRLGKDPIDREVQVVPTGSLGLDIALGIGGLPRGRIVEIYGPESSGKTTLTLHIVAEAQKRGGVCAFIDAEHALDVNYAKKLGVKTDELLVSQPDYGEQALEIADMLVRSNAIDVIVIDSVAALTPKAELEGEMGDMQVGLQARLMSKALRKLTAVIAKSRTMVIFINQIRMKIGVMFGSPETTTGGNALKFYSSVRLDIRRVGALKKEEDVIGNRTRVKVVKNKMAPPFKEVEFDILYGHGVSREGDLVDLGAEANIVEKSGAWFSFNNERIGQGRENAKQFLIDHPEVFNAIEAKVLAHHNVRRIGIDVAPTFSPADAKDAHKDKDSGPVAVENEKSGKSKPHAVAPAVSAPHNGKRPNA
ncbi:MAG: recombinase RecA [Deltaproteobacteria bacterium]|nr:recombinase RecA [Deltaproteobacteria bacterium]MCW5805219.1 recombinase RecA [Deltaproteobacteria bacterium]